MIRVFILIDKIFSYEAWYGIIDIMLYNLKSVENMV